MSRASEFTLFIIIVQASIGFVGATGLFTQQYVLPPSNNATYTITDLEQYTAIENQSITDEVLLFAHWAFEAFFIGIKVVMAVIFVLPTLIYVFNVPAILATFIQVGVYYIYATWYAQYKSGKGWKLYE